MTFADDDVCHYCAASLGRGYGRGAWMCAPYARGLGCGMAVLTSESREGRERASICEGRGAEGRRGTQATTSEDAQAARWAALSAREGEAAGERGESVRQTGRTVHSRGGSGRAGCRPAECSAVGRAVASRCARSDETFETRERAGSGSAARVVSSLSLSVRSVVCGAVLSKQSPKS